MSFLKIYINDFLRYQKWNKRHAQNTLSNYESDLKQFDDFLETESPCQHPDEIETLHIRSWLAMLKNDLELSASSINRKKSCIQSFFKQLCRQNIIRNNPAKNLPYLRSSKRLPQFITQQQAQAIQSDPEEGGIESKFKHLTDELILELLYQCGLRRNELIQLQLNDVEFMMQQIRVRGKGNKQRLIPVHPDLLDKLSHYYSQRALLLPAHSHFLVLEQGKPLYAQYIYRLVKNTLANHSSLQRKSPHVLRHSFATHLLENGANIQSIKELLGHSSLAATQIYTHLAIDQLKDIHQGKHPKG